MKNVALVFILLLAGCASTTSTSSTSSPVFSDPMQIIKAAADSAPKGVPGQYTLQIVATGSQGRYVYLNTEDDYRDQRAITVALHPKIIAQLSAKYGMSPQEYFVNKAIVVDGEAQRVKIVFISDGKPTNKYYYQTHIRLMDISQLEVVGENTQQTL